MKSFLLEICAAPLPGHMPDMENSRPGKLEWKEISPDYYDLYSSHTEVCAKTMSGYVLRWNSIRETLYGYEGAGIHREVFSKESLHALKSCASMDQLSATIGELQTEKQSTAGWREA